MPDIADDANHQAELALQLQLQVRKPTLEAKLFCWNCREPVMPRMLFCDADCAHDFDKRTKR